jgi:mono/diheme cytochrome c family protein
MRDTTAQRNRLDSGSAVCCLALAAILSAIVAGCSTPSANTTSRNYGLRGEVPVDPPRPPAQANDDCAAGGRLYSLYCGSCHNARPISERPFSNYNVAVAHMRDNAYLTGKEYRQIIQFLRRAQDVGPPTPSTEPSPKRLIFSQPNSELRRPGPAESSTPAALPPGTGPRPQPGQNGIPPQGQPNDLPAPIQ